MKRRSDKLMINDEGKDKWLVSEVSSCTAEMMQCSELVQWLIIDFDLRFGLSWSTTCFAAAAPTYTSKLGALG